MSLSDSCYESCCCSDSSSDSSSDSCCESFCSCPDSCYESFCPASCSDNCSDSGPDSCASNPQAAPELSREVASQAWRKWREWITTVGEHNTYIYTAHGHAHPFQGCQELRRCFLATPGSRPPRPSRLEHHPDETSKTHISVLEVRARMGVATRVILVSVVLFTPGADCKPICGR